MRISRTIIAALAALTLVPVAVTPTQAAADDVYTTEGTHVVNGREWRTACEPYSQTRRCRTDIKATVVTYQSGRFVSTYDWTFNSLTYAPSPRSLWQTNPLGGYGKVGGTAAWTGTDGRAWTTECDTATTGRGGCRSYTAADVIEADKTPSGATAYRTVTKNVFNGIVRFSAAPAATTPKPVTPKPADPLAAITDARLRACVRDAVAEFGSVARIEVLYCDAMDITTLKGFPAMPRLVDLSLMQNNLTSLQGLPQLPALEYLTVNDNAITSLKGMPALPALLWLDISSNTLTNLTGLSTLPALEAFDAWSNRFSGTFDLSRLPANVWYADLSDNALTRVTGAGALEVLFLGSNRLTSVTDVAAATNLTALDLSFNQITRVAGLQNLKFLEMLFLEGNDVTDLQVLQPLVEDGCYVDIWPEPVPGTPAPYGADVDVDRYRDVAELLGR
ncbi:hypothetical protein GCM10028820_13810 [Tessaracoccus terricola]